MLYYPNEGQFMSYRNGDKSREHRLRKARQKKREKVRNLSSSNPGNERQPGTSATNK